MQNKSKCPGMCFDGPWRNDACMGYAAIAMKRMGFELSTILAVLSEMHQCFDDTTVDGAAAVLDFMRR